MKVFPAIDLKDGSVVRLFQGDYDRLECYSADPVEVACGFQEQGADCLHVVDLDGARDGALSNFETVRAIVSATELSVEVGGGVRDLERIERYIEVGAYRVILGTAAVKDPAFLDRALAAFGGEKVVVGVDMRAGLVAVDGWTEVTELDGVAFCEHLRERGVKTAICTDIACDGALAGTNPGLYRRLVALGGIDIIASGGVSSLSDVADLAHIGVAGLIIGKALYEGILDVGEVLVVVRDFEAGEEGRL